MNIGEPPSKLFIYFLTDSERVPWGKDDKKLIKKRFLKKLSVINSVFFTTKCLLHNESAS